MFLTLAYGLFIFQVISLLLLTIPIPIRIRRYITEFVVTMSDNFYLRMAFTMLVVIMFGLFAENLVTVLRYDTLRSEFTDLISAAVPGKHEVLLKLFRAQRNIYLTFMVNFNWFVMYGVHRFIKTIHNLESQLRTNHTPDDALINNIIKTETRKEKAL